MKHNTSFLDGEYCLVHVDSFIENCLTTSVHDDGYSRNVDVQLLCIKVDIYVFITPIQCKNNDNSSSFEFKHQNRAQ